MNVENYLYNETNHLILHHTEFETASNYTIQSAYKTNIYNSNLPVFRWNLSLFEKRQKKG